MLTLENSVVKVKRATNVTEIEQWTTVLTTYISVFTHEFPNRAQEFLQYMSIIRHAAQLGDYYPLGKVILGDYYPYHSPTWGLLPLGQLRL